MLWFLIGATRIRSLLRDRNVLSLCERSLVQYLSNERKDPDADEERVCVNALEDVILVSNLTTVNLVTQSHHNEDVKDDRKVLRWRLHVANVATAVNVKKLLAYVHNNHNSNI